MANVHKSLEALVYQVGLFGDYCNTNYSDNPLDLKDAMCYNIDPFDETEAKAYTDINWSGDSGDYNFVVTRAECAETSVHPNGHLSLQFMADIIVIRKTLIVKDRTNNRNLLRFGGTDGAGNVITSIDRVCGDMAKWFCNYTQGGRLVNSSSEENAFKCDIVSISELLNAKDGEKSTSFWYKLLRFESLSLESKTISAT